MRSEMELLPDFLIVGASKSGTSSLYNYLKQHPDIFLSEVQKEGRFFSRMEGNYNGPGDQRIDASLTRSLDDYKALFKGVTHEKVIGDISPDYLYHYEKAIPLIKVVLGPEVAIIIILRSPVDRAFSAYTHFKRDGRENLSFEEALNKEKERKRDNWLWAWQYRNSGLYHDQVKAYTDHFKHVKIILFDDFRDDPQGVLREICAFTGVNPAFHFETTYKYNVSGTPKRAWLYKLESSRRLVSFVKRFLPKKLIRRIKNNWTGEKQMVRSEMDPEIRRQLTAFFKEDILRLEKLINKDLSRWLQESSV